MTKPWQPYAHHILNAIEKINRIKLRGSIIEDEVLYDATLRNLQTLSEAAQRLSESTGEKNVGLCKGIPWQEISGFRNILVHNYLGNIDPLTIVKVIEDYLPPLEACINSLLDKDDAL